MITSLITNWLLRQVDLITSLITNWLLRQVDGQKVWVVKDVKIEPMCAGEGQQRDESPEDLSRSGRRSEDLSRSNQAPYRASVDLSRSNQAPYRASEDLSRSNQAPYRASEDLSRSNQAPYRASRGQPVGPLPAPRLRDAQDGALQQAGDARDGAQQRRQRVSRLVTSPRMRNLIR